MSAPRFLIHQWCCDDGTCLRCHIKPKGHRARVYHDGDYSESGAYFALQSIPRSRFPMKERIRVHPPHGNE